MSSAKRANSHVARSQIAAFPEMLTHIFGPPFKPDGMLEPKVEGALEEEDMDDAAEEEDKEGEEAEEQVPEEEKLVFPADMVHLIVFWTSWAPPCRSALPRVSKLGKKHADCLNVVAVTTEKKDQVLKFADDLQDKNPPITLSLIHI